MRRPLSNSESAKDNEGKGESGDAAQADVESQKEDGSKGKSKDKDTKHEVRKNGENLGHFHDLLVLTSCFVPLDERWAEIFDAKIALLVNREAVDARDYGGKRYEE